MLSEELVELVALLGTEGEFLIDIGKWKPVLLEVEAAKRFAGDFSAEDAESVGVSHDVSRMRLKSVLQESISAGMGDCKRKNDMRKFR